MSNREWPTLKKNRNVNFFSLQYRVYIKIIYQGAYQNLKYLLNNPKNQICITIYDKLISYFTYVLRNGIAFLTVTGMYV